MKTEWQFFFKTKDFKFDKEYKFRVSVEGLTSENKDNIDTEELVFDLRITPDDKPNHPNAEQTGKLFITLPLPYEKAKAIIRQLTYILEQKISFEYGDFKIQGGLKICKNIPETTEEEKEVGEKPYIAQVNLITVVPPINFDSQEFVEKLKNKSDLRFVAQYNYAKNLPNPIEKFLGFFKIIESHFPPVYKKQPLREVLGNNSAFYDIYIKTFKFDNEVQAKESYKDFIRSIIHARHRCAHLKVDEDFGYLPNDPKIKEEIEPLLLPLEVLTYEIIVQCGKAKCKY